MHERWQKEESAATEMPSAAQVLSLDTFFGPAKKVTRLVGRDRPVLPVIFRALKVKVWGLRPPKTPYSFCLPKKSKQKKDTPRSSPLRGSLAAQFSYDGDENSPCGLRQFVPESLG